MPDRMVRGEIRSSERYLALKNNDDRVCFYELLLLCDSLGNYPAGPNRLIKDWRHIGIDSAQKVAQVLNALADEDLVRLYDVGRKPYLHVPRFRQKVRWLGHLWPLSPWNTPEERARVAKRGGGQNVDDSPVQGEIFRVATKYATGANTDVEQNQSVAPKPHADRMLEVEVEAPIGTVELCAGPAPVDNSTRKPGIEIPEGQKQPLTQAENRQYAATLIGTLKPMPKP